MHHPPIQETMTAEGILSCSRYFWFFMIYLSKVAHIHITVVIELDHVRLKCYLSAVFCLKLTDNNG